VESSREPLWLWQSDLTAEQPTVATGLKNLHPTAPAAVSALLRFNFGHPTMRLLLSNLGLQSVRTLPTDSVACKADLRGTKVWINH
jgi:hypothetical protein